MPLRKMLPFEQGGLDSLCGIYSLVNAERTINDTAIEDSRELFNAIIRYLDKMGLLTRILTEGMLLKHIKAILADVIGDRIQYQRLHFEGVKNPVLNKFWTEVATFLGPQRAIVLGMSGIYDHWTVVKNISDNRIDLLDSDGLCWLNRINCTTYDVRGKRHHVLYPAQTYFLGHA